MRLSANTAKHSRIHLKKQRRAQCPSCQQSHLFTYGGEQHWPAKVAHATGVEPVVHLWHCSGCKSTVSECELR